MRGVAYAWLASGVLAIGALAAGPAAAGCNYDDCDDEDRSPRVTHYRSAPSYSHYDERPHYRSYRPEGRTVYYRRYAERPVHKKVYYGDHYYDRPRYRSYDRPRYRPYYKTYHRKHYRSYRYSHHRHYHPTVRYGGAWMQTGYPAGYPYYGGCHTAYIPYGWTWYRARNC